MDFHYQKGAVMYTKRLPASQKQAQSRECQ